MSKKILLIGDSIRLGYCAEVRELLSGRFEVCYPAENCRSSQNILCSLAGWSHLCDPAETVLVLFNCGHWDAAHFNQDPEPLTSLGEYEKNLRSIVRQLRKLFPAARLTFLTTTPMNPNNVAGSNPRTNEDIRRYNETAKRVMDNEGIGVLDLFELAAGWPSPLFKDYCHLVPEGYHRLAERIAGYVSTFFPDN